MDEIQTLPEFEVIFITSVDENIAILQSVICTIIVPVSLLLIYGIVHYEHFGVDPQKRSFFNQAISAWFLSLGILELLVFVPITIRCWTGPFGHIGGMIVAIARRFLILFAALWTIEFLLYKNMSVVAPHYITRFHDDYWAKFCCGWNIIFGISLNVAKWIMEKSRPQIYLFISGEDGMTKSDTRVYPIFLMIWMIIAILVITFMITRMIYNPSLNPSPTHNGLVFNNWKHNPAMLSNLQIILMVFLILAVCSPSVFVKITSPDGFVLLKSMPMAFAAYLIIPVCFYAFNQRLRKYVWIKAKEVCGLN